MPPTGAGPSSWDSGARAAAPSRRSVRRRGERCGGEPDRLRAELVLQVERVHPGGRRQLGEGQAHVQVRRRGPVHRRRPAARTLGACTSTSLPTRRGSWASPGPTRRASASPASCWVTFTGGPGHGGRSRRPPQLQGPLRPGRLPRQRQADREPRAALGDDRALEREERPLGQLRHDAAINPHDRRAGRAGVRAGRQHHLRRAARLAAVRAARRIRLPDHPSERDPGVVRDLLSGRRDGLLDGRALRVRAGVQSDQRVDPSVGSVLPSTGTTATRCRGAAPAQDPNQVPGARSRPTRRA